MIARLSRRYADEIQFVGIDTQDVAGGRIAATLVGKQGEQRLDRYLRLLAADR